MKSAKLPSGLKLSVEQSRINVSENAWYDWIPFSIEWYLEGNLFLPHAQAVKLYGKGIALTIAITKSSEKSKVTVKIPIREVAARRIIAHQAKHHG